MPKDVALIGAEYAGLLTAKLLSDRACDVAVAENESEIGRVRALSHCYPCLESKNLDLTDSLTEHRVPTDYPNGPTEKTRAQSDVASYITHFNLQRQVRFNAETINVDIDVSARQCAIQVRFF